MQPTYLPWMGYFDLIDQSDVFVFLDSVAFSGRSWQQRNRILTKDGPLWLTVPVRQASGTRICDVAIDNTQSWAKKHSTSVERSYRRSPYWDLLAAALGEAYGREWDLLAELDIYLIESLGEQLGVSARFERATHLPATKGAKGGALLEICLELGATTYLSPPGSFDYLHADAGFSAHGIDLVFQHFEHPAYPQSRDEFVPYLSVVDLIANTGPGAAEVIRSGRRPARTVEEMERV